MKPRAFDLDPRSSSPGTAEFGRRPTDTSTRSNVRSFGRVGRQPFAFEA